MSDLIDNFFDNILNKQKIMLTDLSSEGPVINFFGPDLVKLVDQVSEFLKHLQLGPEKKIISICDNTLETALILLGCMRGGFCAFVLPPITTDQDIAEVMHIASNSPVIDCSRKNFSKRSVYEIIEFDLNKSHSFWP
mgnify:CR=1 FL=1